MINLSPNMCQQILTVFINVITFRAWSGNWKVPRKARTRCGDWDKERCQPVEGPSHWGVTWPECRRVIWYLEPNHSFKDDLFSQLPRLAKLFKVHLLMCSQGCVADRKAHQGLVRAEQRPYCLAPISTEGYLLAGWSKLAKIHGFQPSAPKSRETQSS